MEPSDRAPSWLPHPGYIVAEATFNVCASGVRIYFVCSDVGPLEDIEKLRVTESAVATTIVSVIKSIKESRAAAELKLEAEKKAAALAAAAEAKAATPVEGAVEDAAVEDAAVEGAAVEVAAVKVQLSAEVAAEAKAAAEDTLAEAPPPPPLPPPPGAPERPEELTEDEPGEIAD